MALQKAEIPATNVEPHAQAYHRVTSFMNDPKAKTFAIEVSSFASKAARDAGCKPYKKRVYASLGPVSFEDDNATKNMLVMAYELVCASDQHEGFLKDATEV